MPKPDEDHKVLRDGEVLRVTMPMMDSLQRSVASVALTDGFGRPAGNRPGFVYDATDSREAVQAAWDARSAYLRSAWKGPATAAPSPAHTLPPLGSRVVLPPVIGQSHLVA